MKKNIRLLMIAVAGLCCSGCASTSSTGDTLGEWIIPGYSTVAKISESQREVEALRFQARVEGGEVEAAVAIDPATILDAIKNEGWGMLWPVLKDAAKAGAAYYIGKELDSSGGHDDPPPETGGTFVADDGSYIEFSNFNDPRRYTDLSFSATKNSRILIRDVE